MNRRRRESASFCILRIQSKTPVEGVYADERSHREHSNLCCWSCCLGMYSIDMGPSKHHQLTQQHQNELKRLTSWVSASRRVLNKNSFAAVPSPFMRTLARRSSSSHFWLTRRRRPCRGVKTVRLIYAVDIWSYADKQKPLQ